MAVTVLVPLDGSPLAERALPSAAALASRGGRIVLFRANPPRGWTRPTLEYDAEEELANVVERLRADGLPAEACLVHTVPSDLGRLLAETAGERGVDLIVMSTHGRTGLERWLYGSMADQIIRTAPVPVVLIPPGADQAWTGRGEVRIIVPLDGSELAEAALPPAVKVADALAGRLHLLRVVEPPTLTPWDAERAVADARQELHELASPLRATGLAVDIQATLGFAGPTIASVAREQRAQLIAMASHGRGDLARLVLGSITSEVLHHADRPVLVVRPQAVQRAGPEPAGQSRQEQAAPATTILSLTRAEAELLVRGLERLVAEPGGTERDRATANRLLARVRETRVASPQP